MSSRLYLRRQEIDPIQSVRYRPCSFEEKLDTSCTLRSVTWGMAHNVLVLPYFIMPSRKLCSCRNLRIVTWADLTERLFLRSSILHDLALSEVRERLIGQRDLLKRKKLIIAYTLLEPIIHVSLDTEARAH